MIKKFDKNAQRIKRHVRVRGKISGTPERPRLNVFRSNANMYAQIIDDVNGVTWLPLPPSRRISKALPATRKLLARSVSWSQNAPRQRALKKSCSTAAAMSITAVWQSWLTAPAKPA